MGIDPGSSGGIAIVEANNNTLPKIISAIKMPIISLYGKKIIDTKKTYEKLKEYSIDIAIIEKVHAMPR